MPPATRSPKAPGDASKQRNDTDEIEQRRKAHRQQHLKRWSPPRHSIEWHEVGATWAASCRRKAAFLPTSASAASAAHSGSRDVNRLITLCRLYEVPSQSGFPVLRGRGRVCSHPSTREGGGDREACSRPWKMNSIPMSSPAGERTTGSGAFGWLASTGQSLFSLHSARPAVLQQRLPQKLLQS